MTLKLAAAAAAARAPGYLLPITYHLLPPPITLKLVAAAAAARALGYLLPMTYHLLLPPRTLKLKAAAAAGRALGNLLPITHHLLLPELLSAGAFIQHLAAPSIDAHEQRLDICRAPAQLGKAPHGLRQIARLVRSD